MQPVDCLAMACWTGVDESLVEQARERLSVAIPLSAVHAISTSATTSVSRSPSATKDLRPGRARAHEEGWNRSRCV